MFFCIEIENEREWFGKKKTFISYDFFSDFKSMQVVMQMEYENEKRLYYGYAWFDENGELKPVRDIDGLNEEMIRYHEEDYKNPEELYCLIYENYFPNTLITFDIFKLFLNKENIYEYLKKNKNIRCKNIKKIKITNRTGYIMLE